MQSHKLIRRWHSAAVSRVFLIFVGSAEPVVKGEWGTGAEVTSRAVMTSGGRARDVWAVTVCLPLNWLPWIRWSKTRHISLGMDSHTWTMLRPLQQPGLKAKAILALSPEYNCGCCSKMWEHWCRNRPHVPSSPVYLTGVRIHGSRTETGRTLTNQPANKEREQTQQDTGTPQHEHNKSF